MEENQPVILFDGYCNLCNGTVNFLLKHDHKKQFKLVPLQSETGKSLILKFRIPAETDSVVLIDNDEFIVKSDAVIAIARKLSSPWKMLVILRIFPLKVRNKMYDFVAAHRFQWFGKRSVCRIIPENKD